MRFLLSILTAIVLAGTGLSAPNAEVLWTRTIADEGGRYAGWPTLTRLKNGELRVVYSGDRDAHICPWGKVRMIRSADNGETWSKPETVYDCAIDDRDAALLELKDGAQLVFWFTDVDFGDPKYASSERYQKYWNKLDKNAVRRMLGSFCVRSTDGGKTWSAPVRLPAMTPHGPTLLRDGRILMVGMQSRYTRGHLVGDAEEKDEPQHKKIVVCESRDGGRSWQTVAHISPDGWDRWNIAEPTVHEAKDGTLHAYFRYHKGLAHLLYAESRDGGRTWSRLKETDVDGYPPHVLRLRDGRVLLTYARRKEGRMGEFAVISSDDGFTWDVANELVLQRDDNPDLGYATTAELDDGALLTVFYRHLGLHTPAVIQAVKWRLGTKPDRVAEVAVRSASMNKDVPTTVMLPSDYATSGNRRYPVVYLLHGAGNDQRTYACEPILSLADRIGAIVVCPYGSASWWIDSPRMPWMRYETFVAKELVSYVDGHYRTIADRRGRAIAGHSMGGHGACFVGFGHTDIFGAVGNVMGGVDLRPFSTRKDLVKLLGEHAEHPDDWRRFSAISRAEKLRNGEVQFTTVVGTGDFFFSVNRALHDLLSSNRVAHVHQEVRGIDEEHSTHTRTFAYEAMKTVFARFGEFFGRR